MNMRGSPWNDGSGSWACYCRPEHSGAVTADGRVYTWGGGWCGCLGHVNEENELLPREVEGLRGTLAIQIKVGKRKTFVVSDLGKVSCWQQASLLLTTLALLVA
jgi:alpha-tubulin suppressor-like RCC1 family protein